MPISHKHKCIFIHIPKTGGATIETIFGWRPCTNYDFGFSNLIGMMGESGEDVCLKHLTYNEIIEREYVPLKTIKEYFKFSIVRNPWDRMVSYFFHRKKFDNPQGKIQTFDIQTLKENSFLFFEKFTILQYDFLYSDQKCKMDYIIRFENLYEGWLDVCDQLILPSFKTLLNALRVQHGTDRREKDYRKYYTEELKNFIGEIFKKDIDTFEYTF